MNYLSTSEIEAGLATVLQSPKDEGRLEFIVRRPRVNAREVLAEGQLDLIEGLVGDSWYKRGSSRTPDNRPHPDMQLNLINARLIDLLAQSKERWELAGDQLFLDLDLSGENLPAGTQLKIGSAIIQVTDQPHTGCKKFVERFGLDAMKFVNSPLGRQHNLRGINAKVVQAGTIRVGDIATKI